LCQIRGRGREKERKSEWLQIETTARSAQKSIAPQVWLSPKAVSSHCRQHSSCLAFHLVQLQSIGSWIVFHLLHPVLAAAGNADDEDRFRRWGAKRRPALQLSPRPPPLEPQAPLLAGRPSKGGRSAHWQPSMGRVRRACRRVGPLWAGRQTRGAATEVMRFPAASIGTGAAVVESSALALPVQLGAQLRPARQLAAHSLGRALSFYSSRRERN